MFQSSLFLFLLSFQGIRYYCWCCLWIVFVFCWWFRNIPLFKSV